MSHKQYSVIPLILTSKSQCIIITLGTLVIMDIHQNIICQFLVWTVSPKFSPSKLLYRMVWYLLISAIWLATLVQ